MVTQQIVDKASVRGVIVQGNVTGLFQPFRAVFFLKCQQPQNCTISQFRMGFCLQHGFNHPACGRARTFSLLDQAFRCPCPVLPVALWHVKRIGCVFIFMCAARMLRHTLPLVPELYHRLPRLQ